MNAVRRDSTERERVHDDEVIDALGERRRREALRVLHEEQWTTLDGLVARLADGRGTTAPLRDDPSRLRTRLRHVDLPKLAAAELIEFDADTERARRRSWRPLVHRVLEIADRAQRGR